MKYYMRIVSKHEKNAYGRNLYPKYVEFFKTDDADYVKRMNARKRVIFQNVDAEDIPVNPKVMDIHNIAADCVYEHRIGNYEREHWNI